MCNLYVSLSFQLVRAALDRLEAGSAAARPLTQRSNTLKARGLAKICLLSLHYSSFVITFST